LIGEDIALQPARFVRQDLPHLPPPSSFASPPFGHSLRWSFQLFRWSHALGPQVTVVQHPRSLLLAQMYDHFPLPLGMPLDRLLIFSPRARLRPPDTNSLVARVFKLAGLALDETLFGFFFGLRNCRRYAPIRRPAGLLFNTRSLGVLTVVPWGKGP